MTSFESIMDFSQFKLNEQGLLPVIVQHYKTKDVLMLAYMNEEAFDKTIKTGENDLLQQKQKRIVGKR